MSIVSDMDVEKVKFGIVIPVYNHAGTLREVARRALEIHRTVIVVDDGSTDGGIDRLEGLDIHVLQHPINRGKGAAILTAAKASRRLGTTHIVTMDADGQHDPADFRQFVPLVSSCPEAIIVGKRNFEGINVPGITRFGRHFSNFWLRVQTGQSIGDSQSGFRVYPLEVVERLKRRESGFAFEVVGVVKAAWAGVELREVDISVHYPPPHERISHFNFLTDNLKLTLLNTKFTLRSFLPIPHRQILERGDDGPKISLRHPIQSIRIMLNKNASPGQLAAAGSLGVFLGTLPLIGFHTIMILFASGFLRLNKVVALTTSQLCMPPLVPALCIEIGFFLRHGRFLTEISLQTLGHQGLERLFEWVIGSIIFAPLFAAGVWAILYLASIIVKRTIRATN
jgi:glycosyltransferase involved in cell wall biosynthesis